MSSLKVVITRPQQLNTLDEPSKLVFDDFYYPLIKQLAILFDI